MKLVFVLEKLLADVKLVFVLEKLLVDVKNNSAVDKYGGLKLGMPNFRPQTYMFYPLVISVFASFSYTNANALWSSLPCPSA